MLEKEAHLVQPKEVKKRYALKKEIKKILQYYILLNDRVDQNLKFQNANTLNDIIKPF